MSDNINVTPGSGATIAAENLSGALVQRVKLALGATDIDAGDISANNPMPVTLAAGTASIGTVILSSGTVSVGAVTISNTPNVIVTGGTVNLNSPTGGLVVSGTVNTTGSLSGIVVLSGGTVNINAMPSVAVSGTVSVGAVTVSSGNIVISGTTNITNASIVVSGTVNTVGFNASLTGGTLNIGNIVVVSGTVNDSLNQVAGNAVATSVGPTGSGVLRTVIADNCGRTFLTVAGTTNTALANNTVIPLNASYKNKVYALSLTTLQNAAPVTVTLQDGTGGNPVWQVVLQAISGSVSGANLAVTPPAYLFSNSAINTLINMNIVGGTASPIDYSLSYWQDAT